MPETVKDLLRIINQQGVYHSTPTVSVYEAVYFMTERNVSALVVVDDEDRFCGIFTERDCCRRLVLVDKDPRKTKLGEVMTPSSMVVTVQEDDTLAKCLDLMERLGVRHLPVTRNEVPIPVGMISMRAIATHYLPLAERLEKYIGGDR